MKKITFDTVTKHLDTLHGPLLRDFLYGITTPHERQAMSNRLAIINMLLAGKSHAEIAQTLNVGVATVTRGAKELQQNRFKAIKQSWRPSTRE